MACRGVFFALSSEQRDHLLALTTDAERRAYIQDHIEEQWDDVHLLQMDKAWDAVHRCLTDGTLTIGSSPTPLAKLILDGKQLHSDTSTYIANLVDWHELPEISEALKAVTKDSLKARYERLRATDYLQYQISNEDWEYTWDYFSEIPDFVARTYEEGRSILFTVDQ